MILAIFIIIIILNIPSLFYFLSPTGSCTITPLLDIIVDTIMILLRTILPFFIMLILNIIMIRKIFYTSRSTFNQNPLFKKEFQFTVAVIAYNVYFFVLNFPLCIYFIFFDVNEIVGSLNDNQSVFFASYSLVYSITNSLSLCVQTLSFVTYFAFNKLYGQEILYLIATILCCFSFSSEIFNRRRRSTR